MRDQHADRPRRTAKRLVLVVPSRHMLHDDLIASIAEWDQGLEGVVGRDTPLITSARLDSLQLLKLLLWIEEKAGREIDATVVDLAVEWNTVDAIVAFVERESGNP